MAEYKECLPYDNGLENYSLRRYTKSGEEYSDVHNAEEAWAPTGLSALWRAVDCKQHYWGESVYQKWQIFRGQMIYDTSDVGSEFEIEAACIVFHPLGDVVMPYFQPKGGERQYSGDFNLVVVSGADLVIPKTVANYGNLKNSTESFGECSGSEFFKRGCIELNPAGIVAINKGELTKFGLRHSRDISGIDPNGGEEGNEDTYYDGWAYLTWATGVLFDCSKLILNYKTGTSPHFWIHDTKLGYIDEFGHRRLRIGKKTSYQYATSYCTEVGGTNFYYSDKNRYIRRIWPQPDLEGATGKLPGQFSAVGKKFSYIDYSGNERRFQGVPGVVRDTWLGE